MFRISSIQIDGFWHRMDASCEFNRDVNIIIGRNGTGKTTFMNILHSVLSVDLEALAENDFISAVIKLSDGKKTRTIKCQKIENELMQHQSIEYTVTNKKYNLRAFLSEERVPAFYRKKASEQAESLRNKLDKLVILSSLSVYRLRNSEPFEIKDRTGRKIISPVDFRLDQLKRELTIFQLELSQEINTISTKLQKDVLASILYSDGVESNINIPRNFDQKREKRELFQAYKRLNALDSNIRKKIISHIEVIDEAMSRLNKKEELTQKDFEAFQSFVRTQEIIEMSLESENQINKTYKPISDFLETVHEFINDKTFEFESGDLTAFNEEFDGIPTQKLSSGEKQLLIILIETLLQKRERCVFLTDEPELSLHIQWQRNILPAIKKLNPNAQIIAATHSPEIAAKYKSSLIDMQMVINNA